MSEPARCSSCGAPIIWVLTAAHGKPMPLDARPSTDGNVKLEDVGARNGLMEKRAVVLAGLFILQAAEAGEELYMPHHATCPQGREWRRP